MYFVKEPAYNSDSTLNLAFIYQMRHQTVNPSRADKLPVKLTFSQHMF